MKMRPLSHTRPIRDYYSAALLVQDELWFQEIWWCCNYGATKPIE